VSGLTRSSSRAAALRKIGLDVCSIDDNDDDETDSNVRAFLADRLPRATHLLSTIGPDIDGDPVLREYGADIAAATSLAWLGYLSSTSVYGEHAGGWVTEQTLPASPGSKGVERLEAEQGWVSLIASMPNADRLRLCIMRLAGIYGPGRSAIDTLLRREMHFGSDSSSDKNTSRVHVVDVVAALIVATGQASASGVYNVGDDVPASRKEVFAYARRLLRDGLAGPSCTSRLAQLDKAHLDDNSDNSESSQPVSRRERERSSKRVGNHRLRSELLADLQFPSFREGLEAIAYAARDDADMQATNIPSDATK
jgi:nucleoside-diphosphate-sugar epimerase